MILAVMDGEIGRNGRKQHLASGSQHQIHNTLRIGNIGGLLKRHNVDEKHEATTVEREYPPLFNDMRSGLNNIENALQRIIDILDRCEV